LGRKKDGRGHHTRQVATFDSVCLTSIQIWIWVANSYTDAANDLIQEEVRKELIHHEIPQVEIFHVLHIH
jgi:hypothetical protein